MNTGEQVVGLDEFLRVLWGRKIAVIGFGVLAALVAIGSSFLVTKEYRAAVLIAPVTDGTGSQLGALSNLASQFSSLTSLAGLSIGGDSRKEESIAVLQSEVLTEKFISDNNLLPVLFWKKWDASSSRWTVSDNSKIPTLWQGNQLFKNTVRIVATDTKTGLVTLTVTWRDPKLAAAWANQLVALTNSYLRDVTLEESERHLEYLQQQARKAETVGEQQAVYALIQNETNKAMLARGSDQYALKIVDPAVPPEKPYSPKRIMWGLMAFSGVVAFFMIYTFVSLLMSKNHRAPS